MASRESLSNELRALLGSTNVYFQPPESTKIKYPCIIYNLDTGDTQFADNKPYTFTRRYQITYICKDPDSDTIDKIAKHFPRIVFDRHFASDNLNHYTYKLYY